MFKTSILDVTNEELEAFMEEVAGMEGQQTLVTPGHFNLESEDSEDHLFIDAEEDSEIPEGPGFNTVFSRKLFACFVFL